MKRTTGTNIARGTGLALVLALAWFSTQALAPFSPSDQEPKGQRITLLDGMNKVEWGGNDQVVAAYDDRYVTKGPNDWKFVALSSQTLLPLPSLSSLPPLPPNEESTKKSSAGRVLYFRSPIPYPSPNGQWFLYDEIRITQVGSEGFYAGRWRLTRPDGSQSHLIPSNGEFQPGEAVSRGCWLPDGSGWVNLAQKGSSVTLYKLATPGVAPKHIPLPGPLDGLVSTTQDGYLVFVQRYQERVSFIPLHAGQATRPPIELQKSLPRGEFESDGWHGDGSPAYSFSQSDAMVVRLRCEDSRMIAWVHRLLHKPTSHREFWQVFYDGRPPRRLFSTTEYIYYFSLSPDGKRLIYWQDEKAYLYTMP